MDHSGQMAPCPARHCLDTSAAAHYRPLDMGMLQKLGRFVVGGRSAIEDPTEVLRQVYADAYERMLLLRQHADLAPQDYGRQGLETLARAAGQQVERIRALLRERGIGLLPNPPTPPIQPSTNHWARIVRDLERHQALSGRLRELALEFTDSHPSVAAFLGRLCEEDARTCERLRALIARADPQALD